MYIPAWVLIRVAVRMKSVFPVAIPIGILWGFLEMECIITESMSIAH